MKLLISFLFLPSFSFCQSSYIIEDLSKEGQVQALKMNIDKKFSVSGGTITGKTFFTDVLNITGSGGLDAELSVMGVGGVPSATKSPTAIFGSASYTGIGIGSILSAPYTAYIQGMDIRKANYAEYPIALQPNGGNVGIGTISPATKLHVQDGVILSSTTAGFGSFTGYGSSGGCLMFRDTDNAGWTECKFDDGVMSCGTDADGVCD